jgi:hypothetical protein
MRRYFQRWAAVLLAAAAGVTTLPAGPAAAQGFATPPPVFTVSLSASAVELIPKQTATLTATTNRDISGYDLMIYPDVPGAPLLTICVQGTTCSVQVSQDRATSVSYIAVVASTIAPFPPPTIFGQSADVRLTWTPVFVDLTTSIAPGASPAVALSTPVQLTATTTIDVGPTPYYIEIFDATAGTLVTSCGRGRNCTAPVTHTDASTHRYVASTAQFSSTFPAKDVSDSSPPIYVTWAAQPIPLTLTTTADALAEKISLADRTQPIPEGAFTELYWELDNPDGTIASLTPQGGCGFIDCWVRVPYINRRQYSIAFAFSAGEDTTSPPQAALGQSPIVNYPW